MGATQVCFHHIWLALLKFLEPNYHGHLDCTDSLGLDWWALSRLAFGK